VLVYFWHFLKLDEAVKIFWQLFSAVQVIWLGKVLGDFLQAHLVTLLAAHKAFFLSQGFSQS
jgi:hypothetical protein